MPGADPIVDHVNQTIHAPSRRLVAGLVVLAALLAGCADMAFDGGSDLDAVETASTTPGSTPPPTTPPTAEESSAPDSPLTVADLAPAEAEALAGSVNGFGLDLHRELARGESGNVVTSPISASVLLAMVAGGADGSTAEQFVDVLGLEGPRDPRYAALLAQVLDTDDVEVTTANGLWLDDQAILEDDYSTFVRDTFGATIDTVDLGDQESADAIDTWVRDHTEDRIDEIAAELGLPDPRVVLVLANALYFRGTWTTEFDEADTTDEPFMVSGDEPVDVPMMHTSDDTPLEYTRDDDVEVVRLPYGEQQRYAMEVFLPSRGSDLPTFLAGLDQGRLDQLTGQLAPTEDLALGLPSFEVEYGSLLNSALQQLGIVDAFEAADFSRLSPSVAGLSAVVQKTWIRVDEAGTEAAAVTAGAATVSGMPAMIVDRPFAFTIRDLDTGVVLFLGSIADPRS